MILEELLPISVIYREKHFPWPYIDVLKCVKTFNISMRAKTCLKSMVKSIQLVICKKNSTRTRFEHRKFIINRRSAISEIHPIRVVVCLFNGYFPKFARNNFKYSFDPSTVFHYDAVLSVLSYCAIVHNESSK